PGDELTVAAGGEHAVEVAVPENGPVVEDELRPPHRVRDGEGDDEQGDRDDDPPLGTRHRPEREVRTSAAAGAPTAAPCSAHPHPPASMVKTVGVPSPRRAMVSHTSRACSWMFTRYDVAVANSMTAAPTAPAATTTTGARRQSPTSGTARNGRAGITNRGPGISPPHAFFHPACTAT